jgi:hypothetical protein
MNLFPGIRGLLGLLAVLCLDSGLAAQENQATASAVTVEPSLAASRVHLVEGIRACRQGDFATAAGRFEKAAAADPESGLAHLWLGLARWRQGDTSGAEAAVRVALGRKLSAADTRRGDSLLRHLLEGTTAPEVELRPLAAPGILTFLEEPRKELRVGLTASADSNPLLLPEGTAAFLPGGVLVQDTPSDSALNLDLRAAYHPFYRRGGWSLGLVFDGDLVRYSEFGTVDFMQLRGTVQLAWGRDPLAYLSGPLGFTRVPRGSGRAAFLLQAGTTDRQLDGDGLERLVQGAATLVVRPCATTATQFEVLYTDRDVEASAAGGDEASGQEWQAGVHQFLFLGDRARHLRLGVTVGDRSAGLAFDSSQVALEVELAFPLGQRWALQLAASRLEVDYDDVRSNPFFGTGLTVSPREDTLDRWGAALIWQPRPSLRLLARLSRVERETDNGSAGAFFPLSYDRDLAGLGVVWLF